MKCEVKVKVKSIRHSLFPYCLYCEITNRRATPVHRRTLRVLLRLAFTLVRFLCWYVNNLHEI